MQATTGLSKIYDEQQSAEEIAYGSPAVTNQIDEPLRTHSA
jgi:hypothetical protein